MSWYYEYMGSMYELKQRMLTLMDHIDRLRGQCSYFPRWSSVNLIDTRFMRSFFTSSTIEQLIIMPNVIMSARLFLVPWMLESVYQSTCNQGNADYIELDRLVERAMSQVANLRDKQRAAANIASSTAVFRKPQ